MIKNFQDVARYFGVETVDEARISRSVYKNTNCGAWLQFVTTGTEKVKSRYHILLEPQFNSDDTVKVHSFKKGGKWNDKKGWEEIRHSPAEVRLFLGFEDGQQDTIIHGITWAEILEKSTEKDCPFNLHRNTTVISFDAEGYFTVEKLGIKIGTIVEGADAEPEPFTLYFPFSEEVLSDSIKNLEDEADEIWHEWNDPEERIESDDELGAGHPYIKPYDWKKD